jgi:hypothetical protein
VVATIRFTIARHGHEQLVLTQRYLARVDDSGLNRVSGPYASLGITEEVEFVEGVARVAVRSRHLDERVLVGRVGDSRVLQLLIEQYTEKLAVEQVAGSTARIAGRAPSVSAVADVRYPAAAR